MTPAPLTITDPAAPPPVAELLDERAAAAMLSVSPRHFRRLTDAGDAPAPLKLGRLSRWSRAALIAWIAAGCPKTAAGSAALKVI